MERFVPRDSIHPQYRTSKTDIQTGFWWGRTREIEKALDIENKRNNGEDIWLATKDHGGIMKADEEDVGKITGNAEALKSYFESKPFTDFEITKKAIHMEQAIKNVGEASEDYYLFQGNNRALEKKMKNANSIEDQKKILKILLEWRAFPHANLNQQLANHILNAREYNTASPPWEIKRGGNAQDAGRSSWT